MRLALDTNAYSALADGRPEIARRVREAELIGMPVVVLGELRFGFQNGTRVVENEEKLAGFLSASRVHVLELTLETTWVFGEIGVSLRREGRRLSHNDIWIAALCKQFDYTLATDDLDFVAVPGLRVVEI